MYQATPTITKGPKPVKANDHRQPQASATSWDTKKEKPTPSE
jgi:hypothetical protein